MTADKIKELIGLIYGVSLIEDFIIDEAGSLKGRIAVVTNQKHADLEWYVEISPSFLSVQNYGHGTYPFSK